VATRSKSAPGVKARARAFVRKAIRKAEQAEIDLESFARKAAKKVKAAEGDVERSARRTLKKVEAEMAMVTGKTGKKPAAQKTAKKKTAGTTTAKMKATAGRQKAAGSITRGRGRKVAAKSATRRVRPTTRGTRRGSGVVKPPQ
jgi:hypothetical protein